MGSRRPPLRICLRFLGAESAKSGASKYSNASSFGLLTAANSPALPCVCTPGLLQQRRPTSSSSSFNSTPHWLQDLGKCRGEDAQSGGINPEKITADESCLNAPLVDNRGPSASPFKPEETNKDDAAESEHDPKHSNEVPIHSRHHPIIKHFIKLKTRRKYRQEKTNNNNHK